MSNDFNLKKVKYWDKAWQLVDGCSHVSAGCDNCWSAPMTHRFKRGLTDDKGNFTGEIIIRESRLDLPLKTKKPTVWAVWNDLFHERVPIEFIADAFDVMAVCRGEKIITTDGYKTYSKHTFLILTKRPERIYPVLFGSEGGYYLGGGDYIDNVWLGTSVENQEMADERIPELLKGAGEFKKFLSIEPLLGEINLHQYFWAASGAKTNAIHQVVCGGETGRNARPCHPDWVRSLRDQCQEAGVPFFFKGWGTRRCRCYINSSMSRRVGKGLHGGYDCHIHDWGQGVDSRILDGRTHDDLVWG